jgi:hypothetical protein
MKLHQGECGLDVACLTLPRELVGSLFSLDRLFCGFRIGHKPRRRGCWGSETIYVFLSISAMKLGRSAPFFENKSTRTVDLA